MDPKEPDSSDFAPSDGKFLDNMDGQDCICECPTQRDVGSLNRPAKSAATTHMHVSIAANKRLPARLICKFWRALEVGFCSPCTA